MTTKTKNNLQQNNDKRGGGELITQNKILVLVIIMEINFCDLSRVIAVNNISGIIHVYSYRSCSSIDE